MNFFALILTIYMYFLSQFVCAQTLFVQIYCVFLVFSDVCQWVFSFGIEEVWWITDNTDLNNTVLSILHCLVLGLSLQLHKT